MAAAPERDLRRRVCRRIARRSPDDSSPAPAVPRHHRRRRGRVAREDGKGVRARPERDVRVRRHAQLLIPCGGRAAAGERTSHHRSGRDAGEPSEHQPTDGGVDLRLTGPGHSRLVLHGRGAGCLWANCEEIRCGTFVHLIAHFREADVPQVLTYLDASSRAASEGARSVPRVPVRRVTRRQRRARALQRGLFVGPTHSCAVPIGLSAAPCRSGTASRGRRDRRYCRPPSAAPDGQPCPSTSRLRGARRHCCPSR